MLEGQSGGGSLSVGGVAIHSDDTCHENSSPIQKLNFLSILTRISFYIEGLKVTRDMTDVNIEGHNIVEIVKIENSSFLNITWIVAESYERVNRYLTETVLL